MNISRPLRHEEFIGYHVYQAHRALAGILDATLAPYGITGSQWNALNQLERHGAMTQSDLSEVLQRQPATVARMIDRLVKRGLVKRTPHPTDRRTNIVSNTKKATDLLVEVEPYVVKCAESIALGISDEDLATFFRVLDTVQANVSQSEE